MYLSSILRCLIARYKSFRNDIVQMGYRFIKPLKTKDKGFKMVFVFMFKTRYGCQLKKTGKMNNYDL
ncbi:hypothetical protein AT267_01330 [Bacillus cereus]|nr:hypothetical protein AT267_01330 [Bacillus cereus]